MLEDEDASHAFCLKSLGLSLGCRTLGVSSDPASGVSNLMEFLGVGSKNTTKNPSTYKGPEPISCL